MATNSSNTCVLCEKENESPTHVVSEKGFNTLIKCCNEQQMSDIREELTRRYNICAEIFVHNSFRRNFTRVTKRKAIKTSSQTPIKKLRSSSRF